MNSACSDRSSGSNGDQAVPVVALVLAGRRAPRARTAWSTTAAAGRTASAGTCRRATGPRTGPRAGRRSACSPYDTCSPPGPLPMTMTGYSPGGKGRVSAATRQLRQRFALRSRRACAWSIRYMTWGWSTRKPSTSLPAIWMQRSGGRRDDVGRRRLAQQDRDLAEEVAAPEGRALLAVDPDVRGAVEDHVEARPGQALAEDPLARREHDLVEDARRRPSSCGVWRSPNSVNPARMSAISSRVAIRRLPPCLARRPRPVASERSALTRAASLCHQRGASHRTARARPTRRPAGDLARADLVDAARGCGAP